MTTASFLQHCQGTIAGAWQAECLGHWSLNHPTAHLWLAQWTLMPWQAPWQVQSPSPFTPHLPKRIAWQVADRCAQDLIAHGHAHPDRWLAVVDTEGDQGDPLGAALPTDTAILLALLPIALFYHDVPNHLIHASEQVFLTVKAQWQARLPEASAFAQPSLGEIPPHLPRKSVPDWPRIQVAWQVFALALAQICCGHRDPMTLIPQVMTTLATTPQTPPEDHPARGEPQVSGDTHVPTHAYTEMAQCLQGVQQRLTQGAGLATVLAWLLDQGEKGVANQVALALYCFLSAPRDFRCAVVRLLQATQVQPLLAPDAPAIAALTGALVGCYQGGEGLPVAISLILNRLRAGTSTEPAVLERMVSLGAAWAGAYPPYGRSPLPAVMAPANLGKLL